MHTLDAQAAVPEEGHDGPQALHGARGEQPGVPPVERAEVAGLEAHLGGGQVGRDDEDDRGGHGEQGREAEGRVQHVLGRHAHLLQRRHRVLHAALS